MSFLENGIHMKNQLVIKNSKILSSYSKITKNIVILTSSGTKLLGAGKDLFDVIGVSYKKTSKAANFTGKKGQMLDLLTPNNIEANRVLIFGIGEEKSKSPKDFSKLGGAIIHQLISLKQEDVIIISDEIEPASLAKMAAGMKLRHYKFDKYKTKKSDKKRSDKLSITFQVENKLAADKAIKAEMAIVEGTILARDLMNEPPNILGPVEFAKQASDLSKLGVEVEILTDKEMKKLKMGALLAVGQGSVRPSRLAIMRWNGGKKDKAPIAFVGKGVVFDTGGISIKPAGSMEDMKGDMGGAAAVIGLMKTIALRKAKTNIVAVLGLVENMPDGNAYRPGDIITSMSGQTIEVINTDAEGRLVLADALWYTNERFKPKLMINLATLTGAIMVGLGQEYAGLFSNNDKLSDNLFAAGQKTKEKLWRMPLSKEYDKLIDSRFADMKNTGGRYGGAITAAQFLQRFVKDTAWAHLDIAGTAFAVKSDETNTSWAPGFGVALLNRLVLDNYEE